MALGTPLLTSSQHLGFGLGNLPFGVFSTEKNAAPTTSVALGGYALHLPALVREFLPTTPRPILEALYEPILNKFVGLPPDMLADFRASLQTLLAEGNPQGLTAQALLAYATPFAEARMHLPIAPGNYTDFYSSEYHATNVGRMFRPDNPLMPNWKHLPVAYHGRASSIVVSGTDVRRPSGQTKVPDADSPTFGPTRQMDYELETAFIIGQGNRLGEPIPIADTERHIFGMALFNDWSARDIQAWEYQPLGPFLAKNFCSVLSPWLVPLAALEPFKVDSPAQDPAVLPYLTLPGQHHYDITLEVYIRPQGADTETLAGRTNHRHLYWSQAQQLAHHTVSGCNMMPADICASGTISGPTPDSLGCLLEATQRGKNPITLTDGTTRAFLLDGDEVIIKGYAGEGDAKVSFGECRSRVV